jgi:RNA polymerase sigma factor (sigma-70 family)
MIMAKTINMTPQSQSNTLTENELLAFIRQEINNYYKNVEPNIISKVKSAYPSLHIEKIRDIFQEVCIKLVEKAHDENFKLTCSLFYYVYRCCWNKAEHDSRHPEREWQLPTDNMMRDDNSDDFEKQPVQQDKVDQLLNSLFEEPDERAELLNRVCEVVKDLPDPCDKILYGMYSTPKKKQEVIAQECGYSNAAVVKTMASRCKSKFRDKFKSIYESFKKGLLC